MCIRDRISTPVTNKATELSVNDLFNFMRNMSKDINVKFDIQNDQFDMLNKRFDINDEKFEIILVSISILLN